MTFAPTTTTAKSVSTSSRDHHVPRFPFVLQIIRPEVPHRVKTLRITSDLTYDEVLKEACELFKLYFQWKDMYLVKRDILGWNIKIYSEINTIHATTINPLDSTENKLWGLLENNHILELRQTKGPFLGGRYYLAEIVLTDKFNQSMKQKVSQLNQNYIGYREIRGDGNCYYRAVFCGIVESIITSSPLAELDTLPPKPSHLSVDSLNSSSSFSNATSQKSLLSREKSFQFLCEKFSSLIRPCRPTVNYNGLLQALHAAARNHKWMAVEEFEADILDKASGFDEASIIVCKQLLTQFILENKDQEFNGISLENAILFANEKYLKLTEYCTEEILQMEICAEGAFVELGILPSLLGAKCEVIFLDREEANQLNIRQTNGIVMEKTIAEISLLFRPGHYDLLYKRDTPLSREEVDDGILLDDEERSENVSARNQSCSLPSEAKAPSLDSISKAMETDSPNLSLNHQQLAEEMIIDRRERAMKALNEKLHVNENLPTTPPASSQPSTKLRVQSPISNPFTRKAPFPSAQTLAARPIKTYSDVGEEEDRKRDNPSPAILNPKLTDREMDYLIDLIGENDLDFRYNRIHLKQLLEMGFSIQILLDTWIKFRPKLKFTMFSVDWLDFIEATKKEQEQMQSFSTTEPINSIEQKPSNN